MVNGENEEMTPPTWIPEERVKGLEDMLREYNLKTAGPKEELYVPPEGSFVADELASEGPMLTESASKKAKAKEPTLMESLIDLSTAIQEDERLTAELEQLSSSKKPTPKEPAPKETTAKGLTSQSPSLKEPAPMDLLIDLNAGGIAVDDWVRAGPKQLSTTPKERAASKDPNLQQSMPMDLLVELSAEERGGTIHPVIWDQSLLKAGPNQLSTTPKERAARKDPNLKKNMPMDLLVELSAEERGGTIHPGIGDQGLLKAGPEQLSMLKEPAFKEPARKEPKEPTSKEPARKEPTRKEHTRKEPYREEPYRNEPYRKEPTPKEPTRKEPTPKEAAFKEPAFKEAAFEEPAFEEPAFEEPAFEEPAFEEPAFEEPAFEEPAFEEPAFEEATPMGTLIDLSNVPRTKVASLPPMLHGIRHLFGIQRTHEKAVPVFSAIPALVPGKKYEYLSPSSEQGAPNYSSRPVPPHMRNQMSTTPPHMRAPSENSSLTRSLSPVSSSSASAPVRPGLDQSGRFFPNYAWSPATQRSEEREW